MATDITSLPISTLKFSELDNTPDALSGAEQLALVQSGASYKTILQNLYSLYNPSNEVIVNSLSDLPADDGTKIILESGKRYTFNTPVLSPFYLEVPAGAFVTFSCVDLSKAFVYVGSGGAVRGLNFGLLVFDFFLIQAPGGAFFDIDGVGTVFVSHAIAQNCASSSIIRCNTATFFFTQFIVQGGSFLFQDRTDALARQQVSFSHSTIQGDGSGINYISAEGNLNSFVLQDCNFTSQTGDTILDLDPSLEANNTSILLSSIILNNKAGGSRFSPDSLRQDYVNGDFLAIVGSSDSTVSVQMGFESESEVTTINTAGVGELINARWLCQLPERVKFQDFLTFDNTTNTITARLVDGITAFNHALVNGDRITFKAGVSPIGTLPPELSEDINYYAVAVTATTFQISLTNGGPAVPFSTNGTGTNYYRHLSGVNAASWLVYTGLEAEKIAFNGSVSFRTVSGQDRIIHADLVKLDSTDAITTELDLFGKGSTVTVNSSDPQASSMHGLVLMSLNESLRMFVTNDTDTTNLIATDSNITFTKV